MPSGDIEWVMFLYFALGALGGIAFLVGIIRDLIRIVIASRAVKRKNHEGLGL
jgi:hypothetical protein